MFCRPFDFFFFYAFNRYHLQHPFHLICLPFLAITSFIIHVASSMHHAAVVNLLRLQVVRFHAVLNRRELNATSKNGPDHLIFISVLALQCHEQSRSYNDLCNDLVNDRLVNDQCCELLRPFEIWSNRTSTHFSPLIIIFFLLFWGNAGIRQVPANSYHFPVIRFSYITLHSSLGKCRVRRNNAHKLGFSSCGTINFSTVQHSAGTYALTRHFPSRLFPWSVTALQMSKIGYYFC